jgi:hypothetical protein
VGCCADTIAFVLNSSIVTAKITAPQARFRFPLGFFIPSPLDNLLEEKPDPNRGPGACSTEAGGRTVSSGRAWQIQQCVALDAVNRKFK